MISDQSNFHHKVPKTILESRPTSPVTRDTKNSEEVLRLRETRLVETETLILSVRVGRLMQTKIQSECDLIWC